MDTKYEVLASRYDSSEQIKSLGNSWVFSHSETQALGCPRLWTYSYMEGYQTGKRSPNLIYGSIWHMMCEDILKDIKLNEQAYADPKVFKNKIYENFNSWVDKEFRGLENEYTSQELESMYEDIRTRLFHAAEGWRRHVYKNIVPNYEVLEIEMEVYAPILKPDGKLFKPRQYIVAYDMGEKTICRPMFTHERKADITKESIYYDGKDSISTSSKMVYWKWYKIGKIDALLKKKGTNQIWVLDHKTTSSLGSYESKMSLDTQLEGYAYLLRHVIDNNENYKKYREYEICGLLWDLCHSKVPKPPEPLMSGKLSTAKKSCPSWQYEISLNNLINEQDVSEEEIQKYREHIEYCRQNFDQKYFKLCENYFSENSFARIEIENYVHAKKISELRNSLSNIDKYDNKQFAKEAYRYPLCRMNGNCTFASMCVADNTPSVILNKQAPKLIWSKTTTNS